MLSGATAEPRFVEALLVPFHDQVKPIGTVCIVSHRAEKCFDREDERVVRHLAQFASAICWALARPAPRSNGGPPHDRAVVVPDMSAPGVHPRGEGMRRVMSMVHRVSDSNVSVLLTGETGAGKEVIARELHRRSDRRSKEFVKVNCAALAGVR